MILSIQYLRAIAALMVLVFHLTLKLSLAPAILPYAMIGASGVDMFFVISGFVMCYTTEQKLAPPLEFFAKRLIRIVPLYYAVMTAALIIILFWPHAAHATRLAADHIAASYAFLAYPNPSNPTRLWPLVVQGWTLNYEMFFYLLVALTLFWKNKSFRLFLLTSIVVILSIIGAAMDFGLIARFYLSPFLLEFLAGFWLGHFYRLGMRIPPFLCYILLGLSLLWLGALGPTIDPTDWSRLATWGIPLFLLTTSVIFLDREVGFRHFALFSALGDASYSIYLIQFLSVSALATAWRALHLSADTALWKICFVVMGMVVASASGLLLHWMYEKPVTRWLTKQIASPRRFSGTRREVSHGLSLGR